jgi:phage major head subunit gpT-like protein
MAQIGVRDFEKKVRELEEISIVIHAPSSTKVEDYAYKKKAASTAFLSEWIDTRVKPALNGNEFSIINAEYVADTPHGRTKLETLRSSYER